jgi:formamidopyrimidine-DNA glycosylase
MQEERMPELPEIASRAAEMQADLTGKQIAGIEVVQPKCLNVPVEVFTTALTGAVIEAVSHYGKWIQVRTNCGYLLLNLGMGGELLLTDRQHLPEKRRLIFDFSDGSSLAINFWWFGYAHFAALDGLAGHEMTAKLGPNALDLSADDLRERMRGQRGRLKTWLLDQTNLAGIGNAYIHDILFLAGLHPLRALNTLTDAEIDRLADGIQRGLRPSLEKGGAFYELNLRGQKGGFTVDDILIGYREGQPCPVCATPIAKLKTGSTTSFVCPHCQPL